jgi:hypothetical protein
MNRARKQLASLRPRRSRSRPAAKAAAVAAPSLAAGAALMYFLDRRSGRRRRTQLVQRTAGAARRGARRGKRAVRHVSSDATGTVRRATHPRMFQRPPADDVTLAHKVETEIFRDADAPKGTVNVNAVAGVVELRGHVDTEDEIKHLVRGASRIRGVREVRNLLHLTGTPASGDGAA